MTAPPCYEPADTSSSGVRLMKAVLCQRFGTPDDLVLADIPDPVAGAGEGVARGAGRGRGFFVTLLIFGGESTTTALPFSPRGRIVGAGGGDLGGGAKSMGRGFPDSSPGHRIRGYPNSNAARNRPGVPANNIIKLPADLDFDRAAALTITYGTAYHALKHRARLRPGET